MGDSWRWGNLAAAEGVKWLLFGGFGVVGWMRLSASYSRLPDVCEPCMLCVTTAPWQLLLPPPFLSNTAAAHSKLHVPRCSRCPRPLRCTRGLCTGCLDRAHLLCSNSDSKGAPGSMSTELSVVSINQRPLASNYYYVSNTQRCFSDC